MAYQMLEKLKSAFVVVRLVKKLKTIPYTWMEITLQKGEKLEPPFVL